MPKTLKSLNEEGREGREADRNASKGSEGKLPGREGKLNGKEGPWFGIEIAGEGTVSVAIVPAVAVMSSIVRPLPSTPVISGKGTLFPPGTITGSYDCRASSSLFVNFFSV